MLLLAIETSSVRGSLALFADGECLRECVFEEGLVHGRELTARLEEALVLEGLKPDALAAIAVSVGPGSYTGIRVGVTAAKSLGFALRIPVVARSSLEVLAANTLDPAAGAPEGPLVVAPLVNARQDALFGALFAFPGGLETGSAAPVPVRLSPDRALPPEALLAGWESGSGARDPAPGGLHAGGPLLVLGDGADIFLASMRDREGTPPLVRLSREADVPRARLLGLLAGREAAAARFDAEAIHGLEPAYLRITEAERRFAARAALVSGGGPGGAAG